MGVHWQSRQTGWTLHDLRRTFRTKWDELGISIEVAERYINHVSGVHSGIQGIYNRHKYLPEMRDAVAKWEYATCLPSRVPLSYRSSACGLNPGGSRTSQQWE